MYQVYKKESGVFEDKTLLGEYKDFVKAHERAEKEVARNKDLKYVIEETTGHVNNYGELIASVVEEN